MESNPAISGCDDIERLSLEVTGMAAAGLLPPILSDNGDIGTSIVSNKHTVGLAYLIA